MTDGTIEISRISDSMSKLRSYAVFIDGVKSGRINNDETLSFRVTSGKHVVYARIDLIRGNQLHIHVGTGQKVKLQVSAQQGGSRFFVVAVILASSTLISLGAVSIGALACGLGEGWWGYGMGSELSSARGLDM